jgi:CBS-domain-containing membrane protein
MAHRRAHDLLESEMGGHLHEVAAGIARRVGLPVPARYHDRRLIVGLFAFVNGLISISLVSAAAWATRQPLVFPSLGPTAFLLFHTPLARSATPRNTIYGHAIGAGAGYGCLALFGLLHAGPAISAGVTPDRVAAAALSLAVTAGAMIWLGVPHAPAGATTLIVSLGILHTPEQLGILMVGVVLIAAQGFVINRLAGLDYPLWYHARTVPDEDGAGAV